MCRCGGLFEKKIDQLDISTLVCDFMLQKSKYLVRLEQLSKIPLFYNEKLQCHTSYNDGIDLLRFCLFLNRKSPIYISVF